MRSHGFRWTYGLGDAHHFDAVRTSGRVVAEDGRVVAPQQARRLGGEV